MIYEIFESSLVSPYRKSFASSDSTVVLIKVLIETVRGSISTYGNFENFILKTVPISCHSDKSLV